MIQTAAACSDTRPHSKNTNYQKPTLNWQTLFAVWGKNLSMDHMARYK